MSPRNTKIALGVLAAIIVIGGLAALNNTKKPKLAVGQRVEEGGEDAKSRRLRGGRWSSEDSGDDGKGKKKDAASNDTASSRTLTADAEASAGVIIETEAETRERERYERAQANAFKYRVLDPNKIKPTPLEPALKQAAEKYKVPYLVLAAMMYVESGGTHRDGGHSIEAGYGVMNLKENNLVDTAAEAAKLLGRNKEDLFYDQSLNIEGAAALLYSYYEDALATGVPENEAWYMAVSQYSGRPNPELAAALADETAGTIIKGFEIDLKDGGGYLKIPPNPNPPFLPKNWKLVALDPPVTPPGDSTPPPANTPAPPAQ
jgi:hypothetical protein